MTSPTDELQVAMVARMEAFGPLTTLVALRIYDRVEEADRNDVDFPYVAFGRVDEIRDDAECIKGFDIRMQIDCYSREPGKAECLQIADAVQLALHDEELILPDNALVSLAHVRTVCQQVKGDIQTTHAAVIFDAFAEQP
ncbi:MAG: DUF3168 domain-containing protein [Alphaproteobacteria bacterium]|nr:DUF3168 domain-containing protein [Alphaproteobacteria bacterium]